MTISSGFHLTMFEQAYVKVGKNPPIGNVGKNPPLYFVKVCSLLIFLSLLSTLRPKLRSGAHHIYNWLGH
jgi:hypothetical protein